MGIKKKRIIAVLLVVMLLTGCTGAVPSSMEQVSALPAVQGVTMDKQLPQEEIIPEPELDHAQIQQVIDEICERYNAMGAQVAVIDNGQLAGSYAYGWATYNKDPMTVEHKIRIASLSKVVLGVTAMLLHDDGTLDIHDDIGTAWDMEIRNPNFPDVPITPYLILAHISSIASYEEEPSTEYLKVYLRMPYLFHAVEPGVMDSWCYNNYAFRILGMTMELAADRTIDEILDEKLYAVMDVDASFYPGDIQQQELLTTLYNSRKVARTLWEQSRMHGSSEPGATGAFFAGGYMTSAKDLGKIVAMLANDGVYEGQQLLSAESVELMQTCTDTPTMRGTWQAHPLFYLPGYYGREDVYFHTGYGYGVYSCLSYDDATGDGVVVVTTGAQGYKDPYDVSMISVEINEYLYSIL